MPRFIFAVLVFLFSSCNSAFCQFISDDEKKALHELEAKGVKITYSDFYGQLDATNAKLKHSDFRLIGKIPSINAAYFSGHPLSKMDLRHVASQTDLTDLHLDETELSDDSISELDGLKNLFRLSLDGNSLTDKCIDSLLKHEALHALSLAGNEVSNDGAKRIQKNLKHIDRDVRLKTIALFHGTVYKRGNYTKWIHGVVCSSGTGGIVDSDLRQLKLFENLKYLVINNTMVTDSGLDVLLDLRHLEHLDLTNNNRLTENGLKKLFGMMNLKTLRVSRSFDNPVLDRLRTQLPNCKIEITQD